MLAIAPDRVRLDRTGGRGPAARRRAPPPAPSRWGAVGQPQRGAGRPGRGHGRRGHARLIRAAAADLATVVAGLRRRPVTTGGHTMTMQSEGDPREPRVAVVTGAARGIGAATVLRPGPRRMVGGGRRPVRRRPPDPLPARHPRRARRRRRPRQRRARSRPGRRGRPTWPTPPTRPGSPRPWPRPRTRFGGLDAMVAVAGRDRRRRPPVGDAGRPARRRARGRPARPDRGRPGRRSRPSSAARHHARGATWPSPRRPRPADCPSSPPTARPRPASPAWCGAWPPSWPAPASPPTPSAPGPPTRPCWPRAPASTASAGTAPFADQQPVGRLLAPDRGGRRPGLAGRRRTGAPSPAPSSRWTVD